MIEEKCVCDYCGGEVVMDKSMVDLWSHTLLHLQVNSRPTLSGPEAGEDISIYDNNICLACAKTILKGVNKVIESVKKGNKNGY